MKTTLRHKYFSLKPTNLLRSASSILTGVLIAGCSPGNQPERATPKDKIVIRGSNTIGEELAPRLITEYKKDHPSVNFDLEFKATQYGLGALMAGQCDIAAASREPTTNELALAKSREIEFSDHVIGAYSVAVLVNAANPVANLTTDQVRDIFTGTVQNWKDMGGPDAPIHLYIRDPISGTYLGFQELAMEKKPYALEVKTFPNYGGIVQAVAHDTGGIGYASIDLAAKPGVKAVSIGGVAPSGDAVHKGQYPYARVLRLYTGKGKETPAASQFVQFAESANGQKIIGEMGYVTKP